MTAGSAPSFLSLLREFRLARPFNLLGLALVRIARAKCALRVGGERVQNGDDPLARPLMFVCIGTLMAKFTESRRGPPAAGTDSTIAARLDRDQVAALDAWIARHPDPKPTRPEAIRSVLVAHLTNERLLPTRPDLRKSRRAIEVENLNAVNDG